MKTGTFKSFALLVVGVLLVSSCGSGNTSVTARLNSRNITAQVDGVDIVSGGLNASSIVGGVSATGASLSILVRFILPGSQGIIDYVRWDIVDVLSIFPGQQVFVDNANVFAEAQLNGQTQFLQPGSTVIVFNSIGVGEGQRIFATAQVAVPEGLLFIDLSGRVRQGFGF